MASGSVTGLGVDTALPEGSQLPSPLSSIDENLKALAEESGKETLPTRNFTRRRRSTARSIQRTRTLPSSNDNPTSDRMDIPLAVALVPPLGAFLTGGDILRDLLLFLLLFFYLHQLIKVPWELYLASRPRGKRVPPPDASPEQERLHNIIQSELKAAEFAYLTLSVLAPLIGAALLRYVGTALTGKDYISWFSTGVFVLVTGVRPWRHLGRRLRARTEELQAAIQDFHPDAEDMLVRMTRLEEEITQLKKAVATKDELLKWKKAVDESLDLLDVLVAKHEHEAETERETINDRFASLEKAVADALPDGRRRRQTWTITSPSSFFDWLHSQTVTPLETIPPMPRSARTTYRPRLAAVREEDSGIQSGVTSPSHAPQGSGLERSLDILVFPFSVGRRLLLGILHFLHRLV